MRKIVKGVYNKCCRIGHDEKYLGFFMVLPAVILILIFSIYPVIRSLHMSLHDIDAMRNHGFVGLQNYIDLINSPRLWGSFGATLIYGIGSIVIQIGLAISIAIALNKEFFARKFVRALIVIPWAIPTAMSAIMWRRFFHPIDGFINASLRYLGLLQGDFSWFSTPVRAFSVVLFVDAWKFTPLFIMIFLATLQAIPDHYYEAAKIQGATSWQMFTMVTLPILKPTLIVALIMKTIFVLHSFEQIFILTGGGPGASTRILSFFAYQETFGYLNYGTGAAIAFIMFIITVIISIFYIRILTKTDDL